MRAVRRSMCAVAGSIGFVGLLSPHIARRLVGGQHASWETASAEASSPPPPNAKRLYPFFRFDLEAV
ncbi:iron chelate uptake ABC transporter family permease subunit [Brevibacillus nitrificans]|uniref:iron chelate uptake ABC transporter family permease subunit n=1 Tax=Brevibacillus nitrificans TaxID=651560 RepID=UPI00286B357B|nr:iron chelate uptake ABC transporter family permease subunit [Brevibacillus nitrificans]